MSRKERLKVYHGIPKSVIDNHTVFYADFKYGSNLENFTSDSTRLLTNYITGIGLDFSKQIISYSNPQIFSKDILTIDFWLTLKELKDFGRMFSLYNESSQIFILKSMSNTNISLAVTHSENNVKEYNFSLNLQANIPYYYRIVLSNGYVFFYVNSKLVYSGSIITKIKPTGFMINKSTNSDMSYLKSLSGVISDIHISNIDRGDYFPNLPQDFIEGKAIIKPRMGQQQIKGDPMYSQETTDVVKIGSNVNEPQITCSRTSGNWTNGDAIKIKGLSDEIISGKESASPIVKSSTGTNITGTWSNLGTNEATFTLGANSSLTNQDLYITYSLNIPAGNSDFTELPYSIEKVYDEVGNELEEVSEIVIEDDFKNKVAGSVKECPHKAYYKNKNSLMDIGEGEDFDMYSWGQINFDRLSKEDGVCAEKEVNVSGYIPQLLVKFSLIELVERKIGTIPNMDKVTWLKNNISRINVEIKGFGQCPSGNYYQAYMYTYNNGAWGWYNSYIEALTSSTPTFIRIGAVEKNAFYVIENTIDSNGCVSVLLTTKASDGVTKSIISTDYAEIKITMKTDSSFNTFYTENKRARENPCNPILIQKETKTVKRYLPSKECFATECLTYGVTPINDTQSKELSRCDYYYATTLGTGSYNKDRDWYSECLGKLGLNLLSHKFTNDYLQTTADNKVSNIKFVKGLSQSYFNNNGWTIPTSPILNQSSMYFFPSLVCVENEIKLKTVFRELSPIGETSNKGILLYSLPNRPLIK